MILDDDLSSRNCSTHCIKIEKYISAWLTFQSGQTPLMFAAASGLSEFVSLLLAHGADVSTEDEDRCTALHLAVCRPHHPVQTLTQILCRSQEHAKL